MPSDQVSRPSANKFQRAKSVLVGLLAIVGAITIIVPTTIFLFGLLFAAGFSNGKVDKFISSVPSPDGKYKAIHLTYAGGPAMSSYCDDLVLVVPASVPDETAI